MAIEVFPTANDIGGSGTGRTASEQNMIQSVTPGNPKNTILSGMVPAEGTGLAMAVATGTALIEGYLVRLTAVESFTVTDDATKYVWLQLTGTDAYEVTAAAFIETDNLTEPTAAALVARVVSSSGDIDDVFDDYRREGFGFITGTYTGIGSGTNPLTIDLGLTPSYVRASYDAGDVYALSKVWPGNLAYPTFDSIDSSGLDIETVKDGFRVRGTAGSGTAFNKAGTVYNYIAWF
tara:strand:+ start:114 stop:818 length:705 start_codon:yes stop_codon:yes gene_type:complete